MNIPSTVADIAPLRVKRLPVRSAWVRDFAFVRLLVTNMLRVIRGIVASFSKKTDEELEQMENSIRLRLLFGNNTSLSDSTLRLGALLLKWHEHDLKRLSPEIAKSEEPPLQEEDMEILQRYFERRQG